MNIAFASIFYPVFMGGYILAALQRRKDVNLCTCGPYTGDWIPWGGGLSVPPRFKPDVVMPMSWIGQTPPIAYAEARLPFEPDLWIQVDAGFHLSGKPKDGKNFILGTDPHVLDYNPARALADVFFCMQRHYMQPGDVYLPYAHDPIWHAPERRAKEVDACLIGLQYKHRVDWVNALRQRGLSVFFELGPAYEEARALYNSSRVGLNWSTLSDLNARAFELLGYGLPAVMNRVPDMPEFFQEGTHFLAFDTLGEAVEAVVWLLDNPEEAQTIADAGHAAVQEHTWDARVEEILNYARDAA